jgi:hypothetical protein
MSTYEFHRDGIEPLGLPAWLAEIMTEILEYVPEMSVPIDAAISMYLDADATGYGGKWSKPLVVADVLSTVLPSSLGRLASATLDLRRAEADWSDALTCARMATRGSRLTVKEVVRASGMTRNAYNKHFQRQA